MTSFKPKSIMRAIAFGIVVFAASVPAMAKELYVDLASGNDNTSYAENDANNPWATLGRAVWGNANRSDQNSSQAAQAGDTVIVRPGTYGTDQGTASRAIPIYNPTNNGAPGQPITIRADGVVYLQSSTSGPGEAIIGTNGRQHIVWDGFTINEIDVRTVPDTGPVVVWQSDNVIVQNLNIRGKTVDWGDNHNAIRIEYASNVLVRNNNIHQNRGGSNSMNGSAIMLYDSRDVVIEHNQIYDSQGGIFIKGAYGGTANHNIVIRFNWLRDLTFGISNGIVNDAGRGFGAKIYQNVIERTDAAIAFIGYNGSSPANIDVVNNTIFETNSAFFLKPDTSGYDDIVFYNNLVVSSNHGIQGEDITDVSNTNFSHNLYSDVGTLARIAYTNYSMSGWRSSFNQDMTGSMESDPMFNNTATGDFRLRTGSPAIGAGQDVLNLSGSGQDSAVNMGAYITGDEVIGLTTAPLVLARTPAPPTLQ